MGEGESSSKYRFVRKIAEGGMGSVDLAVRQEGEFRRVYAIKRLKTAYREDEQVRSMFTREARIAGLLHHPNVVSVIDVGHDEAGPYLVMDFVEGVSMSQLIKELRRRGELAPQQVVIRVFKHIADGLHAAHELSSHDGKKLELVHRDVSPQNILIGYDGIARITDFGIAKAIGPGEKTSTGILKGKFGYFAPEQLRFRPPTRQSDLFSFGVVVYEALAAQTLFSSKDPARTAQRILEDPPPDIYEVRDDVHPALIELLFELLAKDPDERPATAQEVSLRLDTILAEVLTAEAPMTVGDFIVSRFSDRKDEQRREIDELTVERLQPIGAVGRAASDKSRVGLWLAAVVVILLAGGGVAWAISSTDDVENQQQVEAPTDDVEVETSAPPHESAEEAPTVSELEPALQRNDEIDEAEQRRQQRRQQRLAERARMQRQESEPAMEAVARPAEPQMTNPPAMTMAAGMEDELMGWR